MHRRTFRTLIPMLAMAIMLTVAPSAEAHVVYQGGSQGPYGYYSSLDCVSLYAEYSHGGSHFGYSKSTTWVKQVRNQPPGAPVYCDQPFYRPPTQIVVWREQWYVPFGGSIPRVCSSTNAWISNSGTADHITNIASYSRLLCGSGYYATRTYGQEWNGSWKNGGYTDSGAHASPF